ncbi:type II toxin-antitoxin system HicA family toxin [Methylomarinovum caldicuralii]|uniref:type II toxin-antitoxin system HicA family toxin n=1 Tax=Methylomarinovum caldicuralii TaxID=438856 RepID=UPI002954016C|nr:type II toxin-antitoxin system HicA family toxin [Methylomarinovum caldicuralii]
MTQKEKLLEAIRRNPRTVRFTDACRAAEILGFTYEGGKGSHRVFKRRGELVQLNFQNRGGYIPVYQARQLIAMIEKYGAK